MTKFSLRPEKFVGLKKTLNGTEYALVTGIIWAVKANMNGDILLQTAAIFFLSYLYLKLGIG